MQFGVRQVGKGHPTIFKSLKIISILISTIILKISKTATVHFKNKLMKFVLRYKKTY